MPTRESLMLSDAELLRECAVDTYRASGPGGQKRNKTDSAVRMRHGPTGVVAIAEESRSQHDNKRQALRRLRRAIALDVRQPVERDGFRPSQTLASCLVAGARGAAVRRTNKAPAQGADEPAGQRHDGRMSGTPRVAAGPAVAQKVRLSVGRKDGRWPIVVGEVLDLLEACGAQVSDAAAALGVSTANLVKFLEADAQVWARVNRMRAEQALKPLRL